MIGHRNCITDRLAKEWWRDYQHVMKSGNPLGLSFVEYVASRMVAMAPQTVTTSSTNGAPWYMSQCGHAHEWGASCSNWTEA